MWLWLGLWSNAKKIFPFHHFHRHFLECVEIFFYCLKQLTNHWWFDTFFYEILLKTDTLWVEEETVDNCSLVYQIKYQPLPCCQPLFLPWASMVSLNICAFWSLYWSAKNKWVFLRVSSGSVLVCASKFATQKKLVPMAQKLEPVIL